MYEDHVKLPSAELEEYYAKMLGRKDIVKRD